MVRAKKQIWKTLHFILYQYFSILCDWIIINKPGNKRYIWTTKFLNPYVERKKPDSILIYALFLEQKLPWRHLQVHDLSCMDGILIVWVHSQLFSYLRKLINCDANNQKHKYISRYHGAFILVVPVPLMINSILECSKLHESKLIRNKINMFFLMKLNFNFFQLLERFVYLIFWFSVCSSHLVLAWWFLRGGWLHINYNSLEI